MWAVIITDHILKLATVLLKTVAIALPISMFPIARRVQYIEQFNSIKFVPNRIFIVHVYLIIYRANALFSWRDRLTCIELWLQSRLG